MIQGETFPYEHDVHGNMVFMPHFKHIDPNRPPNMYWDFKDELKNVDLDGGGTADDIYDDRGRRIRKVHKHNGALERGANLSWKF